jgi:hypothetical protein
MMAVLDWAAEHYVLATIFCLIVASTVVETARALRGRSK